MCKNPNSQSTIPWPYDGDEEWDTTGVSKTTNKGIHWSVSAVQVCNDDDHDELDAIPWAGQHPETDECTLESMMAHSPAIQLMLQQLVLEDLAGFMVGALWHSDAPSTLNLGNPLTGRCRVPKCPDKMVPQGVWFDNPSKAIHLRDAVQFYDRQTSRPPPVKSAVRVPAGAWQLTFCASECCVQLILCAVLISCAVLAAAVQLTLCAVLAAVYALLECAVCVAESGVVEPTEPHDVLRPQFVETSSKPMLLRFASLDTEQLMERLHETDPTRANGDHITHALDRELHLLRQCDAEPAFPECSMTINVCDVGLYTQLQTLQARGDIHGSCTEIGNLHLTAHKSSADHQAHLPLGQIEVIQRATALSSDGQAKHTEHMLSSTNESLQANQIGLGGLLKASIDEWLDSINTTGSIAVCCQRVRSAVDKDAQHAVPYAKLAQGLKDDVMRITKAWLTKSDLMAKVTEDGPNTSHVHWRQMSAMWVTRMLRLASHANAGVVVEAMQVESLMVTTTD